jgi:hypothetical protein
MDPVMLIGILQAALAAAGPAIKVAIAEAETVGSDVAAHKNAMTTLEDAVAKLAATFQIAPLPAPAPKAA